MAKLTAGPDPHPRKPKLKAPPGACDTHIHLFGPAEKYPFAPDSPYTSRDALPETFIALQNTLGMSTAVIVSPGGYGRDYSLLADVLAKYPDRFRGIALLRDDTPTSEIARLSRLGVRGMRMMSAKRGQHVPNYSKEIAARVHEHGWHIQFYPHGTDIVEYADKLLALPNTIVLDHFASIPAAGGVDQPAVKAVLKMLHGRAAALPVRHAARARVRQARAGAHGVGLGLAARQSRRHGHAERRRSARSDGGMGARRSGAQSHPDAERQRAVWVLTRPACDLLLIAP